MKKLTVLLIVIALCAARVSRAAGESLRDAFRKSLGAEVVLILNGDDYGKSQSANAAVPLAMEKGILTSSTIIMPALRVPEAEAYIREHPAMDVGVHLNLLAERTNPLYGPLTPAAEVPSLVDENGMFHTIMVKAVPLMKSPQVEKELDAQIKKALDDGIDVTHLDCHMGFYHGDLRMFKIVMGLAKKYGLPMRFPNPGFANTLDRAGILTTDSIAVLSEKKGQSYEVRKAGFIDWLEKLKPGIYEMVVHPATFGPDEKETWREEDMRLVMDPDVRRVVEERGIRLTGYRALRDFQRARAKAAGK